ncbi:G protein-coupled receptor, rhodopsin-like [Sergentomyia squamirostris]
MASTTEDAVTVWQNVSIEPLPTEFSVDETARIVSRVVPVFFGVIGITGLMGNILVVLVVVSNPGMRSTTNILIINLALADLLFVIFCVPFTATDYMLSMWPFGDSWCRVVQYLIVVTAHASIYTLVLMSLDRFLAVVHPIASMVIRTERNTLTAIGVLWLLILSTGIPVFFVHGVRIALGNCAPAPFSSRQGISHLEIMQYDAARLRRICEILRNTNIHN